MRILISYPEILKNEIDLIHQEMNTGKWDLFHLRKPNLTEKEIEVFYNNLNDVVKNKTVLHHLFKGSCHSFIEVDALDGKLDYCFLSPVFDSISKPGYKTPFDREALRTFLKKKRKIKVIALGGVTEENYNELIALGFDGGAFLGSVWKKYIKN
ncbi:MAG: thiamine phosphate synthase [Vicingaceae bacterium]